jgi:hypothetical protein
VTISILHPCERCGHIRITTLVTFKQNVSFIFRRWQRELSGQLCFVCMTATFSKFEIVTLFGTWGGMIGCLLGPYFILTNLFEYLAGSFLIARDVAASFQIGRKRSPPPQTPDTALLGKLGQLMERYPTALLDTYWLPAPKQKMKAVIKDMWRREPQLRAVLAQGYLHLSWFQDGIGDAVLDCKIPPIQAAPHDLEALRREAIEMSSGQLAENLRQWIMWSKVSEAETDILVQEWEKFVRSEGLARNFA